MSMVLALLEKFSCHIPPRQGAGYVSAWTALVNNRLVGDMVGCEINPFQNQNTATFTRESRILSVKKLK
jgi:hypothetical protein